MSHEDNTNHIAPGNPTGEAAITQPLPTRRAIVTYGVRGLVAFLGLEALTSIPGLTNVAGVNEKRAKQEKQSVAAIEAHDALQTKYFAEDIVNTAVRTAEVDETEDHFKVLLGFFTGTAVGGYILDQYPAKIKKLIGLASAGGARFIDELSTLVASVQLADPRVKEYGLDVYFFEESPLSPPTLTPGEALKESIIAFPLITAGGAILPQFGTGYAGMAPFIGKSNLEVASLIGQSLKLGDTIKEMIAEGKNADDVKAYLASLQPPQKVHIPLAEKPTQEA